MKKFFIKLIVHSVFLITVLLKMIAGIVEVSFPIVLLFLAGYIMGYGVGLFIPLADYASEFIGVAFVTVYFFVGSTGEDI